MSEAGRPVKLVSVLLSRLVPPFQSVTRIMALVLLVFAAADLSFPAGCGDAPQTPHSGMALTSGGSTTDSGPGDDCFCCSRTVRTTAIATVLTSVQEVPAPVVVWPAPQSVDVSRLYHPPIA